MSSHARTPEEIREAFAVLRLRCDPRGHGLLDALENLSLIDNAFINLYELAEQNSAPGDARMPSADDPSGVGPLAVAGAENHSRHVSLVPDVDGYEIGSAKYEHLRLVDSGER